MKSNKTPDELTARQAISFGMFGDESVLDSLSRLEKEPTAHRMYQQVQKELRDALASGKVQARGVLKTAASTHKIRELIAADLFDIYRNMTVDATNETTILSPGGEKNFPKVTDIRISRSDIETLWPRGGPDLDRWMAKDFGGHPDTKRKDRIADCVKANSCTHAEATKAFNRVPSEGRRGRGRRISAGGK